MQGSRFRRGLKECTSHGKMELGTNIDSILGLTTGTQTLSYSTDLFFDPAMLDLDNQVVGSAAVKSLHSTRFPYCRDDIPGAVARIIGFSKLLAQHAVAWNRLP
jgi:hypothetical protein